MSYATQTQIKYLQAQIDALAAKVATLLPPAPVVVTPPAPVPPAPVPPGVWFSGQSDTNTTKDGSFATWRGRPVEIAGNWAAADSVGNQYASSGWCLPAGTAYGSVPRIDYACGAILAGDTWAQAAAGAYDARWGSLLDKLGADFRNGSPARPNSNLFIRFAHEMNGDWYTWSVKPADVNNFKAAWIRFYKLVQAHIAGAKLVWCPNAGSHFAYDIRTLYPGDDVVDVVGIDSYNNWPWVNDAAGWNAKINQTDSFGGPAGLETFRQFAQLHGKPLAVCEWSSAAINNGGGGGDSPFYFQAMHDWLAANGGTGPGNVLYEIVFNVGGYGDHYELFPATQMPNAAARYRQLF